MHFDRNLLRNIRFIMLRVQTAGQLFAAVSFLLINFSPVFPAVSLSDLTSGMLGFPCIVSCTDMLLDPL